MRNVILDLCGGTGSWALPYKNAGYDVKTITLPDYDVTQTEIGEQHQTLLFTGNTGEMMTVYMEDVCGILAAPPCTEFSMVRNHNIGHDFDSALVIVNACLDIIKATKPIFWALENPIGHLSKFLGAPKFSFQPYEFGDGWTKKTNIWGEFNKPVKKFTWDTCPKIPELYVRPSRGKPSMACLHKSAQSKIPQLRNFQVDNDASFRAITPPAFAQAFFDVNNPIIYYN